MKLIVGLGNPGKLYIDSRHNIGFSVVNALAKSHKVVFKKDSGVCALTAKCKLRNEFVLLAMPLTFMNLSGLAVSALLKKYKIDLPRPCAQERGLDNLLVVCDNLDLELGRQKIRPYGSAGGHQGLKSIIGSLKSERFARLRIGIARPQRDVEVSEYVLSPFTLKEKAQVKEVIEKAILACELWVRKGITKTMNMVNKRDNL